MIRVSDRALLRFLDRAGGLNVEGLRHQLEESFARAGAAAAQLGVDNFYIHADGHFYAVRGGVITTVLPEDSSLTRRFHALDQERGRS